ncbi:hypothetical protein ACIRBX_08250 [Kitasatospora sp. NPDC096147]|uniref:hypothetical protein n=1 Tax=Kitasatospora sp. NPDC096147 TaxID=3364093 RepID=UPI0038156FF6
MTHNDVARRSALTDTTFAARPLTLRSLAGRVADRVPDEPTLRSLERQLPLRSLHRVSEGGR